jgi:hypothetical protein
MPFRRRVLESMERLQIPGERLERFLRCGTEAWVYQSKLDPSRFRVCHNHCGDRLCLPCGQLRGFFLRKALQGKLASLPKPPLFITLTLAGQPDESLREKINRLYDGFSQLRRLKLWKGRIRGGAAFLEIKHSAKAGRWHPHLHILCDGNFLEQARLQEAWHAITGDSFIVDIRRANDTPGAANYVTKYVTKPIQADFASNAALLEEAIMALRGRRLCLTFGDWYRIPLKGVNDEDLTEDPMDDTTWASIGSLESVLERAQSGDQSAAHALRCLRRGSRDCEPRAPA